MHLFAQLSTLHLFAQLSTFAFVVHWLVAYMHIWIYLYLRDNVAVLVNVEMLQRQCFGDGILLVALRQQHLRSFVLGLVNRFLVEFQISLAHLVGIDGRPVEQSDNGCCCENKEKGAFGKGAFGQYIVCQMPSANC